LSSTTFLIDAASRHSVLLQRYSAGIEKDAAEKVSKALDGVIAALATTEARSTRSLRLQIIANYRADLVDVEAELYDEFIALAAQEDDFNVDMFEEAINAEIAAVNPAVMATAIDQARINVIPGQGVTIPDMLSQFTEAKARQVNTILLDGFTEGATKAQLIERLKEVQPMQEMQAATIARTGNNSVSSIARQQAELANSDVLDGYEWVSTLDNRTSDVCIARDGEVYSFAAGDPRPPAHFNCRSTTIPRVSKEYDKLSEIKGDRPAIGADGRGTVSGQSTYGGWLRKQPAGFQDEVLGPTRAKLFRQGGLSVSKFVNFDGKTYTLDELRALNPLAFEKANL
jgi:SPP1 gp7 family putative phage head morphogenesis protein